MTDTETLAKLQKLVEKQDRKIKRLEKRFLEKKKYERAMLINTCSTPQFISMIDQKDREALEG